MQRNRCIAIIFVFLLSACSGLSPAPASRQIASRPSAGQAGEKRNPVSVIPVSENGILEDDNDQNLTNVGAKPKSPQRDEFVGIYNNPNYTPLLDLVDYAQKTIDIEIYMMNDAAFRAALRRAMARGVVIRVVKDPDPLGETCKYFDDVAAAAGACVDEKKLVAEIRGKGSFAPFDKAALCGQANSSQSGRCFEHGKIMIVDRELPERRLALISTGNFNDSNLCVLEDKPSTCNRDYTYVSRDSEVVDGLVGIFENDNNKIRFKNDNPSLGRKITVSPFSDAPLVAFIQRARTRIQLQNQYMKDPDWNKALMDAAQKGVNVELMVASDCSFGPPKDPIKKELEARYKSFEAAGIHLRFFSSAMQQRGKNGYLHAKAMVIDGVDGWIGSENGSTTSLDENREYGIFFRQPERVKFLSEIMAEDFQDPNGETWQEAFECKRDSPGHSGAQANHEKF